MQFGMKASAKLDTKKIVRAADKSAFKNIFHAAASISKDVKLSLKRSDTPSTPGSPPHIGKRRKLKRAIRFDANKEKQEAVIGPMASIVGDSGSAHEHGGLYKGDRYDKRPFMQPALKRATPRFAGSFRGSLGR